MEAKKTHTTRHKTSNSHTTIKHPKVSHLGRATSELITDSKRVANDSKRVANELYEEGRNRINEVHGNIKDYSNKIADKVNEKPLISLLIAGGVGFILSALFRRR